MKKNETLFMSHVQEMLVHARTADNEYRRLIHECASRRVENSTLKKLLARIYADLKLRGVVDFTPDEVELLESL